VDLRTRIDNSPMSFYQWLIIAICTFLNALDGYDVLAISFSSNQVTEEFGLSGTALGLVMSAALFGMAAGALILGPVADRIGRRNMIVLAIIVNAIGLFMSATASSANQLGLWRIVTGLGIGGILVATNVISAEYSSRKRRGLVISIYAAGYGIGAAVGGSVMVALIASFGWRSVFVLGGALAVFSLLLVVFLVPESASFLYNRKPNNAQARLEAIAGRLGFDGPVDVSAGEDLSAEDSHSGTGVLALFNRQNRRVTFVVWTTFFIIMFGFYFVNSWTPRLMHETGLTDTLSMIVTVGLTLGGAIGSVVFGLFTARWSTRSVLMTFSIVAAVLMAIFIFMAQWIAVVVVFGVLVGMSINGCIAGLYVLTPQSYSSTLRSTGAGWGIGIGRFGAIIAPTATGAMLDGGWSPQTIYIFVGAVLLLASLVLLGMRGVDVEANKRPQGHNRVSADAE
jgi:benzoate transport